MSATPERDALVRVLRGHGRLVVHDGGPALTVDPRGEGGPAATLEIEEEHLAAYVGEVAHDHAGGGDPRENARGAVALDVLDHLTTDHGGGVNAVCRLTLVRDRDRLRFVEERAEIPPVPPLPPGSYEWSADPGRP